jgi:hypothetical protein
LHLSGSVFTEPFHISGLHNPVVPLFVRVLLRNGCFFGSAVLAWVKYAKIFIQSLKPTPKQINKYGFTPEITAQKIIKLL